MVSSGCVSTASVEDGASVDAFSVVSASPPLVSAQAANEASSITIASKADISFIEILVVIEKTPFSF
jgi:hypothetical protein